MFSSFPPIHRSSPATFNLTTRLTRNIPLNIPLVSAAMDTVTEARTAITMAREGGIGIIHKNFTIREQALEVDKVKKSESGMIVDPITMRPNQKIREALDIMAKYRISGVPITKPNGKLVGILTNRDLRFETNLDLPISDRMTKRNLVTVAVGTTLEQAKEHLKHTRVEKLLVVDDEKNLKGLITIKDIEKVKKYPNACKDSLGRLRVGAAVGPSPDMLARADALIKAGVDVIVIDTAHGHSQGVIDAVRQFKETFPTMELIAGNIATAEAAEALIHGRGGRHQGRHRAGLHLHHPGSGRGRGAPDHRHQRLCHRLPEKREFLSSPTAASSIPATSPRPWPPGPTW